jgi:drug/metabolite transporter (DMT)-like permease
MQPTGRWKLGLFLASLTALMWGLLPVALKALLEDMDPYTITWYRFLVAAAILGGFLVRKRRFPALSRLNWRGRVLLITAILGLIANYLLYLVGLNWVTPATSQMVIQLAPMFLLLGGLLFFHESFQTGQWVGFAVLIAGLLLFFNNRLSDLASGGGTYYAGVVITTVAAVCWAAYALIQKRLLRVYDSEQILVLIYAAAVLLIFPLTHFRQLFLLNRLQLVLLLFCCLNTLVAYGAFAEALAHWEASRVSAVLAVAPLLTLLTVWAISRWFPSYAIPEHLDKLSIFGAFLVVAGSIAAALARRRARVPVPRPME